MLTNCQYRDIVILSLSISFKKGESKMEKGKETILNRCDSGFHLSDRLFRRCYRLTSCQKLTIRKELGLT